MAKTEQEKALVHARICLAVEVLRQLPRFMAIMPPGTDPAVVTRDVCDLVERFPAFVASDPAKLVNCVLNAVASMSTLHLNPFVREDDPDSSWRFRNCTLPNPCVFILHNPCGVITLDASMEPEPPKGNPDS